jgi:hypothetical protein
MLTGKETDAEIVEICKREMQGLIERTDFSRETSEELHDSTGMPHGMVRLIAADLTEIGQFELDLPPAAYVGQPVVLAVSLRKHWVYRHRDGRIVTLQLSKKTALRQLGYIEAPAFFNDMGARS